MLFCIKFITVNGQFNSSPSRSGLGRVIMGDKLIISSYSLEEQPDITRLFEGKIIEDKKHKIFEGWSGWVVCEEIEGKVFINQYGCKKGSIIAGEDIKFNLEVYAKPRGDLGFRGVNWETYKTRTKPLRDVIPVYDVTDLTELSEKFELDYKSNSNILLLSRPGYKFEDFESNFSSKIEKYSLIRRRDFWQRFVKEIGRDNYLSLGNYELIELKNTTLPKSNLKQKIVTNSLINYKYQRIIQSSVNNWVIVGDETGTLIEFKGKRPTRISRMLWVAIPPRSKLPILHKNYHGMDVEFFGDDTFNAWTSMVNEEGIGCFSFTFSEGHNNPKIKSKGVANSDHLRMWQYSLPLVLEWVAQRNQYLVSGVEIFIENVYPLKAGTSPVAPLLQEYFDALSKRVSWKKLVLGENTVLSKNPNQHPWLGYSDSLGHVFNQDLPLNFAEASLKVKDKCIELPFKQSSLSGPIRDLIKSTSNPMRFLKSLYDLEVSDFQDYVVPLFGGAISECLNNLKDEEWDDLLQHFDLMSRDKNGQRVTNFIDEFIKIVEHGGNISDKRIKFDFLRMILGTSNHKGQIIRGARCRKECNELLESFSPTSEKLNTFQNLVYGLEHNVFIFKEVDISLELYTQYPTKGNARRLGIESIRLSLQGGVENFRSAKEMQKVLIQHGDDRRSVQRHTLLYSEILLELGEYEEAKSAIKSVQYSKTDSYYHAFLRKYRFLSGETMFLQSHTNEEILNDNHPSHRIAYWALKLELQQEESQPELVAKYLNHLVGLTGTKRFSSDAPGLMLACQLLDLEYDGLEIPIDTKKFFDSVKDKSQPSTRQWIEQNQPNEKNWLAPLNFNYK